MRPFSNSEFDLSFSRVDLSESMVFIIAFSWLMFPPETPKDRCFVY